MAGPDSRPGAQRRFVQPSPEPVAAARERRQSQLQRLLRERGIPALLAVVALVVFTHQGRQLKALARQVQHLETARPSLAAAASPPTSERPCLHRKRLVPIPCAQAKACEPPSTLRPSHARRIQARAGTTDVLLCDP